MNSAFELKSAGYWGGGRVGIKCCIQTTIWTQSSTLNLNREPLIEGVSMEWMPTCAGPCGAISTSVYTDCIPVDSVPITTHLLKKII